MTARRPDVPHALREQSRGRFRRSVKINTRFRRSVYQAGEHTFTRESVGTRYVPAFVHSVNHLTARRRADTSPAYGRVGQPASGKSTASGWLCTTTYQCQQTSITGKLFSTHP